MTTLKRLKLYHLFQDERSGWDTFSDMVVCAADADEARNIHPRNWKTGDPWKETESWCSSPELVEVQLIGVAEPHVQPGIVCSSFHAG